MLEATNKQEAIISCTSPLFCVIQSLTSHRRKKAWLNLCAWENVKELFIEIKTEYYNNQDYTNKF